MVKKVEEGDSKKDVVKTKKSSEKKMTAREREELLVENFVGLQHAMTNMSIKFGALSDNIVKLLNVFEEAAKSFASGGRSDDRDLLDKIDSLLNQNKTIAKGLVLMEGKLRGRVDAPQMTGNRLQVTGAGGTSYSRPKPLPSI